MSTMSSTFEISASMPASFTYSRTRCSSALHLAHPVPRTLIFFDVKVIYCGLKLRFEKCPEKLSGFFPVGAIEAIADARRVDLALNQSGIF